ncbi:MAG: nickel-dependent lactate racemase [Firmicutes bacterium]|nr:nickel-dependent lactate racemase [Bacillota bacterium]
MKYRLFQGKNDLAIDLPNNWEVTDIPMPDETPLVNPEDQLRQLLKNPKDSPPISEIVKPTDFIAICVTDITRPSPDFIILPCLLEELENAGVPRQNVNIIVGTGSHRAVTYAEMKAKFGYYATSNYRIMNHDCRDAFNLADLGPSSAGVPRVINSILTKVNHIFSIGVTELHQYAGYSGGAKTIAIGCAGEETIQYTHSPDFLEKSGAVPGRMENNLFQKTLWDIVEPLPFRFMINTILNEKSEIIHIEAGKPRTVYDSLISKAKNMFEYNVDKGYDIAYLGVPWPKDQNLYQATRAATYQALAEKPALKKGAIINIFCECPEGTGKGMGEIRFKDKMSKLPNAAAILLSMKGKKALPGEQRAFITAKAMLDYKINVVGTKIPMDELLGMGFLAQKSIPEDLAKRDLKALVIRDGTKRVVNLDINSGKIGNGISK